MLAVSGERDVAIEIEKEEAVNHPMGGTMSASRARGRRTSSTLSVLLSVDEGRPTGKRHACGADGPCGCATAVATWWTEIASMSWRAPAGGCTLS